MRAMAGLHLIHLSGTSRDGERAELSGERFVIGRGADCDLTLEADLVSRRHLRIELVGGDWLAEDLGSRNGTFLNGRPVSCAALRDLDLVQLGPKGPLLRVESLDPPPPTPP